MATTFWVSMDFSSISCMIASDTLFEGIVFFRVKLSNGGIAEIQGLKNVAMATNFRTKLPASEL